MGKKPKPVSLGSADISNARRIERQQQEELLRGRKPISKTPPAELCDKGKKAYKEIVQSLPENFLCNLDANALTTCADSIANMQKAREILNREGLVIETSQGLKQHPLLLAYAKHSDIFRKYADDLGLNPSARANLALMKTQQIEEETDPLLKLLKGGQKKVK